MKRKHLYLVPDILAFGTQTVNRNVGRDEGPVLCGKLFVASFLRQAF
jgi:hypothetical protein